MNIITYIFLPQTILVDTIVDGPSKHFKSFQTMSWFAASRLFDKIYRKDRKPFFMTSQEFYD